MKTALPLSEHIERDLRAVLEKESNCITSPECLKHSIMRARFVEHFAELLMKQQLELCAKYDRHNPLNYALWLCGELFDAAVDRIYSPAAARS